jgi:hypothetical protein
VHSIHVLSPQIHVELRNFECSILHTSEMFIVPYFILPMLCSRANSRPQVSVADRAIGDALVRCHAVAVQLAADLGACDTASVLFSRARAGLPAQRREGGRRRTPAARAASLPSAPAVLDGGHVDSLSKSATRTLTHTHTHQHIRSLTYTRTQLS